MRAAAFAIGVLLAACGRSDLETLPRQADTAALTPSEAIALVLRESLGQLRGMDRMLLQITLPDATVLQVQTALPTMLRSQSSDGVTQLLRNGAAIELRNGEKATLTGSELTQTLALLALCDAATLGPLRRASQCRRIGPYAFELVQQDGSSWQLQLRPNTLLPAQLGGPFGNVEFLEHLHTATTWILRRARLAPLGECTLRFVANDLPADDTQFELPKTAPKDALDPAVETSPKPRQMGRESQPTSPQIEVSKPVRWLICDDPGNWPARQQLVQLLATTLTNGGQSFAGFPCYFHEKDRARLAIGFRAKPDNAPFTPPIGYEIRDLQAGNVIVVFPVAGDYAERVALGETQLRAELRARQRTAAGPICAQPYLHLEEGLPPPEKLAAPVLRMSVAVR